MHRSILFYLVSTVLVFAAAHATAQEGAEVAFVVDEADVLDEQVEDTLATQLRDHQTDTGIFVRVVVSEAFDEEKATAVERYEEAAAEASEYRGRWLLGVVNPEGTSAAVRVGSDLTEELPRKQAHDLIEIAASNAVAEGDRRTLAVHLGDEFVAETAQLDGPLTVRSVLSTYSPMRHIGAAFWLLMLLGAGPTLLMAKLNDIEWGAFGSEHAFTIQLVSICVLASVASLIYLEQAHWAAPLVVLSGALTALILVHGTGPIKLVVTLAALAYILVNTFVVEVLPSRVSGFQFQLAAMAGIQFVLLIGTALSLFTGRRSIDPRGFESDWQDDMRE